MPPFVLTVLKILLLLLLYFFIYRAVRSITSDLYGRRERGGRQKTRPVRRPRGGAPKRVVLLDPGGKKVGSHPLAGTLQIGRAKSCKIRPDDSYISEVHAQIAPRGDGWVVEDMGSTNGTYLNQRKITVPTPIAAGDRIRVGKSVLEVRR